MDLKLDLKVLKPCQRTEKVMEHEGDGGTNCNWCAWSDPQRLGRDGNRRMNKDHPNYWINKIGQNTEKSPGDLRSLAVTHSSKRPSVNCDVKDSQDVK